jgi:hypothetical protein
MVLDWRNRIDVAIIITAAAVAAIISGTVITGGAIVAVGSIIGVPAIVSVIIFIRWPGAQETPCRRVLLGWLIIILLFRGGVMPFPGHIVVVIFIFQFPIEKEQEVLAKVRDSSSSDQAQKSHSSAFQCRGAHAT